MRAVSRIAVLIALTTAPQLLWVPVSVRAAPSDSAPDLQARNNVSLQELEHGIADRLKRVEEFKFIEQEAAKLGVRAWLFGGTAAGYAHYVKWDMQRETGDKRFQKDRFDYDYTNIYRSTQDLDIVIDGNAEQAQRLQSALAEKYPHLQGSKTAWEVRLLTQDMGDKQAILNNPDFMNQHTDSNSTGLIEITKPKEGETVVRDVRDWKAKEPYFLKDVHEGALHYYLSPLHETTKFAKEGRNPPILSAIRYLTKAFQYELKLRPEDLERIKKVINEFDPKRDTQNDYVAHWIEKNGKKLIQNAVNIEYAKNTLDQLGLREKLQAIHGNISKSESLAWWMDKEPLRTQPLGQGEGKTAQELGLDIVAHETKDFLAYESITRAHTGDPNVLISRGGASGEQAIYGDGFYTKVGREGARGSGLTIRFHLDPHAREGADFEYLGDEHYVVVKNKAALKVIPESLNIGPVEFFRMLSHESSSFAKSDLGVLEKLKRRIRSKAQALSSAERKEIARMIREEIKSGSLVMKRDYDTVMVSPLIREALDTVPELIELRPVEFYRMLAGERRRFNEADSKVMGRIREWFEARHPHLSQSEQTKILNLVKQEVAIVTASSSEGAHVFRPLLEQWFSSPSALKHPEIVEELLESGKANPALIKKVISQPQWLSQQPEWVDRFISDPKLREDRWINIHVLSNPLSAKHPDWVKKVIERGGDDQSFIGYVLTQPHWQSDPQWAQWVDRLILKNDPLIDRGIAGLVLDAPVSQNHPEWVEDLFKRKYAGAKDIKYAGYVMRADPRDIEQWQDIEWKLSEVLEMPHWKSHPGLRRIVGDKDPTVKALLHVYKTEDGTYFRVSSGACITQNLDRILK
ncbi:MAG: hypothetical protein ACJ763_19140 [Bdellovibrionia bacterium]